MRRIPALFGLVVALACPIAALAQASGSDTTSSTRLDVFFPQDSTAASLLHPQISPPSYDTLTAAYAVQPSVHTSPPSLDVSDRVQTVWVVKYR